MAGEHMRTGRFGAPLAPEMREVADPQREIIDMAGGGIQPQPARSRLPAPVRRRDRPALLAPVLTGFEIFLIGIAPPRQEQDGAARRAIGRGPVQPPDRMAIGQAPPALARAMGNCPAIERRPPALGNVANLNLLAVVTVW
ncbi:hypothetical protein AEB_P3299 [Altererythrobacter sp. B11]|nr:hypothetical protein AEB_P3299 [Altererythrobacter sp. B11]